MKKKELKSHMVNGELFTEEQKNCSGQREQSKNSRNMTRNELNTCIDLRRTIRY